MNVESAEVSLAYTYAWWLTGDETAARAAVLAAVDRPEVPGADADLRREILLRRVRAAAIAEPTMCPASELALLHDAIGLGLDSAAGLAAINSREARTELAHGRLEALGPGAEFEIMEPERLGGLAVGNPADVAAARQNPELAQLRKMILAGRDELVSLSEIEVPADLLTDVAARGRGGTAGEASDPTDDWFADADEGAPAVDDVDDSDDDLDALVRSTPAAPVVPRVDGDAADATADADPYDEVEGEEIDLTAQIEDAPSRSRGLATPSQRRVNLVWLMVGLVALIGVAVLLTSGGEDAAPDPVAATDAAPTDTTTELTDATTEPTDSATEPTPESTPADPADPVIDLAFDRAGVSVGIGSDPDYDNPVAGPFDPVSVTVEYRGAADGDVFVVDWTVDGAPLTMERVDLSPLLTSARFSRQVPEEGWPVGQHVLTFSAGDGEAPLGEARFVVTPDGAAVEGPEAEA